MTTCIRVALPEDGSALAEIYEPFVSRAATSFEEVAPSAAEMSERVQELAGRLPFLVCCHQDHVLGFAYAAPHRTRASYRFSVDVSVYVRDDARRRGVGRGLYTSLFALLDAQGYYAAHAGITLPNAASVGLHEACGFTLVGVYPRVGYKLGAWHDVGWWQREIRERSGHPDEPALLPDVSSDATWRARSQVGLGALSIERDWLPRTGPK